MSSRDGHLGIGHKRGSGRVRLVSPLIHRAKLANNGDPSTKSQGSEQSVHGINF